MRWKEKFFVSADADDPGLTIAGFYYISLSTRTGAIDGLYYDPNSTPFQELRLQPVLAQSGLHFAEYRFA